MGFHSSPRRFVALASLAAGLLIPLSRDRAVPGMSCFLQTPDIVGQLLYLVSPSLLSVASVVAIVG